jgi:hypothetical protein
MYHARVLLPMEARSCWKNPHLNPVCSSGCDSGEERVDAEGNED